ncbi:protein ACCELERATED CELL DEATH 6-like [Impatiens glandulifera]|uniref:protein ACCELERATED CELL DEATH 6-like n=1 Tax=Impatiens glandulifera TaxID=253017 RepID=UPI001FB0AF44|nr:protein ACCELERATED CELL DEATH 6-like [Impatiens glandulifera]
MGVSDLEIGMSYDRRRWRSQLNQLLQQQQQQNGKHVVVEVDMQSSSSEQHTTELVGIIKSIDPTPPPPPMVLMDLRLHRATIEGNQRKFIDTLVTVSTEKGLPVTSILDQLTPLGNTFLHLATDFGHFDLVAHLAFSFPHLLNTTNGRGDTPFILAARSPQSLSNFITHIHEFTPYFVDMFKITNNDGNTALHQALITNHNADILDLLLQLLRGDKEVPFCYANQQGKTPLYIAIETGQITIVTKMLRLLPENPDEIKIAGKSPIDAAIKAMNTDMLVMVCEKIPSLIHTRVAEDGGTPLHCAASVGYYKGVEFFLNRFSEFILEHDNNGLLPIHIASQKGYVKIVKKILDEYPDSRELLTAKRENILHIASKFGKIGVVEYILKTPYFGVLINQKDNNGNTPLHLATMNWFPKIVSCLTWESSVELNIVNDDGMTALDIVEEFGGISPSFRKRLTWIALKAAGGKPSRAPNKLNNMDSILIQNDGAQSRVDYKDRVNTLLLVSTLVATVTFAAGFTMPGGYNNTLSDPFLGQATMLNKRAFQTFVICDAIAMYSAVIVAVTLIWAQLGDVHLVFSSISLAMPLLGVSLLAMSTAFLAGVWLVITKLGWLSHLILIIGIVFLSILLALYIPLIVPTTSKNYVIRYISYYFFFQLMLIASGSNAADDEEVEDGAA